MSESEAIKAIFGDVIRDAVRDALQELKPEEPEKAKDEFYTRDEVCRKLDICHATFHNWKNKGVFKTKKIGNKVFVLKDEFDADFAADKFVKFRIKPRLWTLIPKWKGYSSPGRMYLSASMMS